MYHEVTKTGASVVAAVESVTGVVLGPVAMLMSKLEDTLLAAKESISWSLVSRASYVLSVLQML